MKKFSEMTPEETARITWAMESVMEFELLPFFSRMNEQARLRIADFLVRLIGTEDLYRHQTSAFSSETRPDGYEYCSETKTGGVCFTADQRLRWVTDVVIEDWGIWPEDGMNDIRAFYTRFFPATDGKRAIRPSDIADAVEDPAPKPVVPELKGTPDPELEKRFAQAAETLRGRT